MFASTDYALPRNPEGNSVRRAREADSMGPLTILAMFAIAAFCGVAIPYLGIMAPAIIGALALSAVVLALSPLTIIWLMLVLVLLVVGQLTFFLGIYQAIWLPYLLLLLIAVKSVMEQLRFTARTADTPGLGAVWVLIILFCLLFCLSALANKTGFAAIGVAGKNYLFPWFLTLLVASAIPKTDDLRNVWKFMLWVAMLQVLFAIPQHFYFAKQIGADWDAIVGSFGGNYLRGGSSGAMVTFLVFGIVLAASLFRHKLIGWKMLLGVVLSALMTVALGEVKIFFISLPIALILLFRRSILLNPVRSLGIGLLVAVLLGLVLFSYQQTYSESFSKTRTLDGFIEYVISVESDPYAFNPKTRELSRAGAVLMWDRYNDADDHRFFIGHGPATSHESETLGVGATARKYPFTLATSTASSLLWDLGLAGYLVLLAILLVSGVNAFKFARQAPPMDAAVLDSIGVMLLLNVPLSLYNRDLIESPATQVLVAFWIGYVLLFRKTLRVTARTSREDSRMPT